MQSFDVVTAFVLNAEAKKIGTRRGQRLHNRLAQI
jgi:hypothetical protein